MAELCCKCSSTGSGHARVQRVKGRQITVRTNALLLGLIADPLQFDARQQRDCRGRKVIVSGSHRQSFGSTCGGPNPKTEPGIFSSF